MKFYLPILASSTLPQLSLAAKCRPQTESSLPPCEIKGCSRELCTDQDITSSCLWQDQFYCYKAVGTVCERDETTGVCGWRQTETLTDCLVNPPTYILGNVISSDCRVDGCNGRVCTDRQVISNGCEFEDTDVCYNNDDAVCERDQATGECGWRMTDEMKACLANPPPLPDY